MFARHPKIAERWAKKYGVPKDLPEKVTGGPRRLKDRLKRKPNKFMSTSSTGVGG